MKAFRTLALAGLVALSAGTAAYAHDRDGRDEAAIRDQGLPGHEYLNTQNVLEGRSSTVGPAPTQYGEYGMNRTHGRSFWHRPAYEQGQ